MYFYKLPIYRKKAGKLKGMSSILFISMLLTLMSANYIIVINAYIGNQKKLLIEGEVVELSSGKLKLGAFSVLLYFSNYQVLVKESISGDYIKLEVSKDHFMSLKKGQIYSRTWTKGSLNLIYSKY